MQNAMAVGAQHITLRDLIHDLLLGQFRGNHPVDLSFLRRTIAMVEVQSGGMSHPTLLTLQGFLEVAEPLVEGIPCLLVRGQSSFTILHVPLMLVLGTFVFHALIVVNPLHEVRQADPTRIELAPSLRQSDVQHQHTPGPTCDVFLRGNVT